ncbi:MAG: GFA family protein [Gammaproteobacteria bacterium]|nr:GFA family protein [Gammaproteobacteria bacterium]
MIEGGCHCGAVRYRIEGELIDAGYCHCDICRQTTGAPVLAWATFPFGAFHYTQGAPTVYHSSDWGQREFCGGCGTQFCYHERKDPESIDVNIGTLDDPEQFEPEYHIFVAEQLEWFDVDDDLPRYDDSGRDGD